MFGCLELNFDRCSLGNLGRMGLVAFVKIIGVEKSEFSPSLLWAVGH